MVKNKFKNRFLVLCIIFSMLFIIIPTVLADPSSVDLISESNYSTEFVFATSNPASVYTENFATWDDDFDDDDYCYNGYYYATHDTHVASTYPDTNYRTSSVIEVTSYPPVQFYKAYIQWEGETYITGNPAYEFFATSDNAKLNIYKISGSGHNTYIYARSEPVNTATITWNNAEKDPWYNGDLQASLLDPPNGWLSYTFPSTIQENLYLTTGSGSATFSSVESSNDPYYKFLSYKFIEDTGNKLSVINDASETIVLTKSVTPVGLLEGDIVKVTIDNTGDIDSDIIINGQTINLDGVGGGILRSFEVNSNGAGLLEEIIFSIESETNKIWRVTDLTIVRPSATNSFTVNPYGMRTVSLADNTYNFVYIYENGILMETLTNFVVPVETEIIFNKIYPTVINLAYFDNAEDDNTLDYNNFKTFIEKTEGGSPRSGWLSTPFFSADEDSTFNITIYDLQFDTEVYNDTDIEVSSQVDIFIDSEYCYIYIEDDVNGERLSFNDFYVYVGFTLLDGNRFLGIIGVEIEIEIQDLYGNVVGSDLYTVTLGNNDIVIEVPYSYPCYIFIEDTGGKLLNFNNFVVYIDGSYLSGNLFYGELDDEIEIVVQDFFGDVVGTATYTVIDGDNSITIEIPYLTLQNNAGEVINVSLIQNGHYKGTYSFDLDYVYSRPDYFEHYGDGFAIIDKVIDAHDKILHIYNDTIRTDYKLSPGIVDWGVGPHGNYKVRDGEWIEGVDDWGTSGNPTDWVINEAEGDFSIISELDGHSYLIECDRDSQPGIFNMGKDFTSAASGIIDFYFRVDGVTANHILEFRFRSLTARGLYLLVNFNAGKLSYSSVDPITIDIADIVANTWYHVSLEFECGEGAFKGLAADTFNIYLDGVSIGTDLTFRNPDDAIDNMFVVVQGETIYKTYIDSLAFSSDGYIQFDNLFRPEGWIISDGIDTVTTVIDEFDGHIDILKMDDQSGVNKPSANLFFADTHTDGIIDGWFNIDTTASYTFHILGYDSSIIIWSLYNVGANLNFDNGGGGIDTGFDIIIDSWYHFSIVFDYIADTVEVFIDGNSIYTDDLNAEDTELARIKLRMVEAGTGSVYYDAFGFSWDGYIPFTNFPRSSILLDQTPSYKSDYQSVTGIVDWGEGPQGDYKVRDDVWIEGVMDWRTAQNPDLSDWTISEGDDTSVNIISNFDGHDDIIKIYDNSGSYVASAYTQFTSTQESGTVEFWYQTSDSNYWNYVTILRGAWNGENGVLLRTITNELRYLDLSDEYQTIMSISANTWYHFRIDFECGTGSYKGLSADRFDMYVDSIQLVSDGEFNRVQTDLEFFYTEGKDTATGTYYIDSLGYSWEGYTQYANLFEPVGFQGHNLNKLLVVNDYDNHINSVYGLNTQDVAKTAYIEWTSQSSGIVDFYMSSTWIDARSYITIKEGVATAGIQIAMTSATNLRIYYADAVVDIIVVPDKLYHISVKFDCVTDTQSVWLNGDLKVSNEPFLYSVDLTNLNRFYLTLYPDSDMYIDSLGFSWEGYEQFSNTIPVNVDGDEIRDREDYKYAGGIDQWGEGPQGDYKVRDGDWIPGVVDWGTSGDPSGWTNADADTFDIVAKYNDHSYLMRMGNIDATWGTISADVSITELLWDGWFRRVDSNNQIYIRARNSGTGVEACGLFIDGSGNIFIYYNDGNTDTGTDITDYDWHHFSIDWVSGSYSKLWIDGILVGDESSNSYTMNTIQVASYNGLGYFDSFGFGSEGYQQFSNLFRPKGWIVNSVVDLFEVVDNFEGHNNPMHIISDATGVVKLPVSGVPSGQLIISAWINLRQTNKQLVLFATDTEGSAASGLLYFRNDGTIDFRGQVGFDTDVATYTTGWNHYQMVFTVNSDAYLYINGDLVSTRTAFNNDIETIRFNTDDENDNEYYVDSVGLSWDGYKVFDNNPEINNYKNHLGISQWENWDSSASDPDCDVNVINSGLGHTNILHLSDASDSGNAETSIDISNIIDGSIEWWWYADDLTTPSIMLMYEDATQIGYFLLASDLLQYYTFDPTVLHPITEVYVYTWYHMKVDFDCATNTMDVYLDGKLVSNGIPFANDGSKLNLVKFSTGTGPANYNMYVDAIGFSWDNYKQFSNSPYEFRSSGSFEFWTNFEEETTQLDMNNLNLFWNTTELTYLNYLNVYETIQNLDQIDGLWHHYELTWLENYFKIYKDEILIGTYYMYPFNLDVFEFIGYNNSDFYLDALDFSWSEDYYNNRNTEINGSTDLWDWLAYPDWEEDYYQSTIYWGDSGDPEGWTVIETGGAVIDIVDFEGHNDVVRFTDNDVSNYCKMSMSIDPNPTYVDFWIYRNLKSAFQSTLQVILEGSSTTRIDISLPYIDDDELRYGTSGGSQDPNIDLPYQEWFRVSIFDIDYSFYTFSIAINGVTEGTGFTFRYSGNIDKIYIGNPSFTNDDLLETYIDALSFSSDNYYQFQNMLENTTESPLDADYNPDSHQVFPYSNKLVDYDSDWGYFANITDLYDNLLESQTIQIDQNELIYTPAQTRMNLISIADQRNNFLDFQNYKVRLDGSLIYEEYFYRELGITVNISIYDRFDIYLTSTTHTVTRDDNFIPIQLTLHSLKIYNQQEVFNWVNVTRDPNYYSSDQYWSEWIAPGEIIHYRIPSGYWKLNVTSNEYSSSSVYYYTLNGDDVILISSYNTFYNVLNNIENVNTTLGNQITNVEINITNQNSEINNTIINIEINLDNINSSLTNVLIDQNSVLELINSTINNILVNQSVIMDINSSISNLIINQNSFLEVMNVSIDNLFVSQNSFLEIMNSSLNSLLITQNANITTILSNILTYYTAQTSQLNAVNSSIANQIITQGVFLALMNSTIQDLVISNFVGIESVNSTIVSLIADQNLFLSLMDVNITDASISQILAIENINSTIVNLLLSQDILLDLIDSNITTMMIQQISTYNLASDINTLLISQGVEIIAINVSISNLLIDQGTNIDIANANITALMLQTTNGFNVLNSSVSYVFLQMNDSIWLVDTHLTNFQADLESDIIILESNIYGYLDVNVTTNIYELGNNITNQMIDLTTDVYLINNSIYTAIATMSQSLTIDNNYIHGNLSIVIGMNEYLTQIYQKTLFSDLLNWTDAYNNVTYLEDQIELYDFINLYRNETVNLILKYQGEIEEIMVLAGESFEQFLPAEEMWYKVENMKNEMLLDWTAIKNQTVSFGFYEDIFIPESIDYSFDIILFILIGVVVGGMIYFLFFKFRKEIEINYKKPSGKKNNYKTKFGERAIRDDR